MVLGRLIHASGYPHLSPIRRTWITKIFLLGDIFCFLVQLFGAAKLVDPKTPKDVETGQNIILAGLGLQIIIFGFFIIVGVTFHVRFRKRGRAFKKSLLEQQLYTIYICSILVLVRSVFRLLEYKNGEDGYLMRNEWPVYAFDVFLMAVVMIISLNWYRGSLEPDVHGDSLLLDG